MIGEITHNLRSALDGLIQQLALLQTKTPASNAQFPIFLIGRTTRTRSNGSWIGHFENMWIRKTPRSALHLVHGDGRQMIRDLHPDHQAIIENLQPYKRGRGGRKSILYLLSEINNADKHRLIQVAGVLSGAISWSGWSNDSIDDTWKAVRGFHVLEDGAKFGEVRMDVHVNPEIIPLMAFWQGCKAVQGRAVQYTLRLALEEVSEIVESFSTAFD